MPFGFSGIPAFAQPPNRQVISDVPFLRYLRGEQIRPFAPPGFPSVPSAQRYRKLAPSEQQGYGGYLESELGLNPADVFWLMQRLAPRGVGNFIPRWLL